MTRAAGLPLFVALGVAVVLLTGCGSETGSGAGPEDSTTDYDLGSALPTAERVASVLGDNWTINNAAASLDISALGSGMGGSSGDEGCDAAGRAVDLAEGAVEAASETFYVEVDSGSPRLAAWTAIRYESKVAAEAALATMVDFVGTCKNVTDAEYPLVEDVLSTPGALGFHIELVGDDTDRNAAVNRDDVLFMTVSRESSEIADQMLELQTGFLPE